MRIAIGGFLHESHSFAPRPTTYQDFREPGGLPPLQIGDALIPALRPCSIGTAGAIQHVTAAAAFELIRTRATRERVIACCSDELIALDNLQACQHGHQRPVGSEIGRAHV